MGRVENRYLLLAIQNNELFFLKTVIYRSSGNEKLSARQEKQRGGILERERSESK